MKIDAKVVARLKSLIDEGNLALRLVSISSSGYNYWSDQGKAVSTYATSSSEFLDRIFGSETNYSQHFKSHTKSLSCVYGTSDIHRSIGVLQAALNDYEGGYLINTRILIEAEVFGDLLEQAQQLFDKGYYQPAAVVVGCVLEDALRKMCAKHGIALTSKPKLDSMNADLVKINVYNGLVQKQVTAWADLRNKAAHGLWTEFTKDDVKNMMSGVGAFMAQHYA